MNENKDKKINFERISIKATRWIGSMGSLIIHTIFFIGCFVLYFYGVSIDKILLFLTTIVSLEAIYLAIFIQMSVNRQARKLKAVAKDVDEIQEDVEEIQKDVDEIQEDVEEIQEDVEEIEKDVDEIQEDVEEIQEEEIIEEKEEDETLNRIENTLGRLIKEITELKKQNQNTKTKK
ncbi:TPA: DUF1003 domain-containing protein [Candidatus Nomurabacteria bacterium]|nr:MAG: hypothetical protein O210_OD1C00001G0114 [Parcubacteria bacterium RAAC4_OD1_1]HCY26685.1 DUF1003 domain-containing protein [Candidatus Nomurabacteria bacterium]